MQDYLVFRLYGPMASWGHAAVGGERHSASYPTRSAILGMVSAALGIKREDGVALKAMGDGLLVAVKQLSHGITISDYHTAQVPSKSKQLKLTRRDELSEQKLNTVLSNRHYRCDGLWVIALFLPPQSNLDLKEIETALKYPTFSLSLGRKSCPIAAPLAPKLLTLTSLQDALDFEFPALSRSHQEDEYLLDTSGATYFWEGDEDLIDLPGKYASQQWDDPADRRLWQFRQRRVFQAAKR